MKKKTIRTISISLACGMLFLTACSPADYAQVGQMLAETARNQNQTEPEEVTGRIETPVSEDMSEEHIYEIEKKTMPMYLCGPGGVEEDKIELAFMDGADDIPYISMEAFRDFYVEMLKGISSEDSDLEMEKDGDTVTLTRETGYPVRFDFAADTIKFLDYDAFLKTNENSPLMNVIACTGFNDAGEPEYFEYSDTSFERYGEMVTFRPGDYGIDLVSQDGEEFIPVQIISDILLSNYSYTTLFNTKALFIVGGPLDDEAAELYYIEDAPKERSDALIDFNYKETCFALDAMYGLKEQHHITDFDLLFQETGLYAPMMSKDPEEAGQAIADLTFKYFDDQHSGALFRSYMAKDDLVRNFGPSSVASREERKRYSAARKKFYPDGFVPYEEVGNTAFITFDDFIYADIDYYGGEKPEDYLEYDTVGLILYAYEQITREDSPIENIVLDLSNNGGGMADAAGYVIGAFLGEGSISQMNTLSGALVSEVFKVDLNLDRKFDEKDSFKDYNLFCLTSCNSFSCGNLVPSALKSSHRVTLIGEDTGGGACVVRYLTSADGVQYRISGTSRLAYMKNGSFYDIDQGVEPDFVIANPELLYDRKYISKYMNELMGK